MAVLVRIPTPLRSLTRGQAEVQAAADSVGGLIEDLEKQYPGLKDRLVDEGGEVRRFINFYVNEEDIRFLQGAKTALKTGDQVSIVPAIAGGSGAGPRGDRALRPWRGCASDSPIPPSSSSSRSSITS